MNRKYEKESSSDSTNTIDSIPQWRVMAENIKKREEKYRIKYGKYEKYSQIRIRWQHLAEEELSYQPVCHVKRCQTASIQ